MACAYCWVVEIVGAGTADVISDGGENPNIRIYGAQPMLRAYVVFTVSCTSYRTVRYAVEGNVTKQRLVIS